MRSLDFEPPTRERLREMVGHGLDKLLEQAVGPSLAAEGVRRFREFYPSVAVEKSHLLPGAADVLKGLCGSGYRLALASNKPLRFSRMILEAKGVLGCFQAFAGPDSTCAPKPDPAMLHGLMASLGSLPAETVCVGDMEVDVEFARAAGCRAIVVPTGSRSREYLESVGADILISDLAELPVVLDRLESGP
jgi:phosphoglycolate phosphatase